VAPAEGPHCAAKGGNAMCAGGDEEERWFSVREENRHDGDPRWSLPTSKWRERSENEGMSRMSGSSWQLCSRPRNLSTADGLKEVAMGPLRRMQLKRETGGITAAESPLNSVRRRVTGLSYLIPARRTDEMRVAWISLEGPAWQA
jgi:hypothetical protein